MAAIAALDQPSGSSLRPRCSLVRQLTRLPGFPEVLVTRLRESHEVAAYDAVERLVKAAKAVGPRRRHPCRDARSRQPTGRDARTHRRGEETLADGNRSRPRNASQPPDCSRTDFSSARAKKGRRLKSRRPSLKAGLAYASPTAPYQSAAEFVDCRCCCRTPCTRRSPFPRCSDRSTP